jgi:hypothetical protein
MHAPVLVLVGPAAPPACLITPGPAPVTPPAGFLGASGHFLEAAPLPHEPPTGAAASSHTRLEAQASPAAEDSLPRA